MGAHRATRKQNHLTAFRTAVVGVLSIAVFLTGGVFVTHASVAPAGPVEVITAVQDDQANGQANGQTNGQVQIIPASHTNFMFSAHRAGYLEPDPDKAQNSVDAVKWAIANGVEDIETDVWMLKDGKWVVFHDKTIPYSTCNKYHGMYIGDLDAAMVSELWCWGQPVPMLYQVLDVIKAASGVRVHVEMKMYDNPSGYAEEYWGRKLAEFIDARGMLSRSIAMSFRFWAVKEMKETRPLLWTAILRYEWSTYYMDLAAQYKANEAHAHYPTGATAAFAAEMTARGLLPWAWDVKDGTEARLLDTWEYGGVTADEPVRVRQEYELAT